MIDRRRTLPQALAEAARSNEGFVFIVGGVEQRRSYAEIQRQSLAIAAALRQSGLLPGDVVALVIEETEPFVTTFLGASLAGLIPASVSPPTTTGDLSQYFVLTAAVLKTARARAVVSSSRLAARFEDLRTHCPELQWIVSLTDLAAVETGPIPSLSAAAPVLDEIAFVQFTSGSTSAPKGIAVSHANLCANIDAVNGPSGIGTTSADLAVSWLPLYHDMGLVGMVLGPLYASRPAVLLSPHAFIRRPLDWLRAISRYGATVSFAPNFAYDLVVRRVSRRDLEGLDLSRWRIAGCGAEPIHAATLDAFAERLADVGFERSSFFPCYGLAEHVLAAALPPRHRDLRLDQGIVSCGRALPGHRIAVLSDGVPAAERELGEIALAGPSVMQGYYNDPAATAETLRDGWLYTGDIGYLAGGELFVVARSKELIIANGRKFYPQDLERAVDGVEGIRPGRAVAFGVQQPGAKDRVVMLVEAAGGTAAIAGVIRRRVSEAVGLYVDEVAAVPSGTIERTTSGKVRRTAAKAWYERRC